jgi:WhiB family redox-sensing transcriptional regulator
MSRRAHVTHGSFGNARGGTNAPGFDGTQPCSQTDPDIFFPEIGTPRSITKAALAICRSCQFQTPCLEYALHEPVLGIWGATTDVERKKLKRRLKIA